MADEFVPIQKAAEELGVAVEALKQAISRREMSALLDGGTFKIRRGELDRYKARRQAEETIALPPEDVPEAEIVEAELVEAPPPAAQQEEPTLEAIEETAETVDTEITLDDLETVKDEPPTVTPAPGEPPTVELLSEGEATEEISLGDDLEMAPVSDDIPLEGEDAKTVPLEAGEGGEALEEAAEGEMGDLDEPSQEAEGEGLEARVHILEARPQGSPFFAALTVLTSLLLLFIGSTLWGFTRDHVPGYLEWILK